MHLNNQKVLQQETSNAKAMAILPAVDVAVRIYDNKKLGKTHGPGKFFNAIFNATADLSNPCQKYLLDYMSFDDWYKSARNPDQMESLEILTHNMVKSGADKSQIVASWIKRFDQSGHKVIVAGYSAMDLSERQLELIICDPEFHIENYWQLEVRTCRENPGQKSPQYLATNCNLK